MKEQTEMVNPFDYTYDRDQLITINANALLSFMSFLEEVVEKEPKFAALSVYPGKTTELKDENGELVRVDIEWKDHNSNSFFLTAADKNGGVPIMTNIALKGNQLLYGLTQIHQENINNKVAKKKEDIDAENVFKG